MRRILFPLLFLIASFANAEVIDRVAAIIEGEVLTLSEVDQIVTLRLIPRLAGDSEADYRRRVVDAMIAQSLRFRDVERFGAVDVSRDSIEARLREVMARFVSQPEFDAALVRTELTLDEVQALIKRQMQVEAYVEERFSPLIFVSLDAIEAYYRDMWAPQRRARGLAITPLAE
ncbi:MAG TPA: hypothetical protein VIL97_10865, partial [Thermoanaerobaculia bacterium]